MTDDASPKGNSGVFEQRTYVQGDRTIIAATEVDPVTGIPAMLSRTLYEGSATTAPVGPTGQQIGPPMRVKFLINAGNLQEAFERYDAAAAKVCEEVCARYLADRQRAALTQGVRPRPGRS